MTDIGEKLALPISALEVLAHLSQIARGDIGDFIDDTGHITLARGNTILVKRYRKRGNTTAIELFSALDALKMLAQYHGLISRHKQRQTTKQTLEPLLRI